MGTNPNREVINMDAPNTVPLTRDLAHELAAVSAAILDKKDERTRNAKRINLAIKDLEKRQRELIDEIKAGGTQLAIHFGTRVEAVKADAAAAADVDLDDDELLENADDDHEGEEDDEFDVEEETH